MSGASSSETIIYQGDTVRLDVFLTQKYSDRYTRSYWTNMIDHGYVLVDGLQRKCGFKLKADHTIEISWPEITDEYSKKVAVIHEDDSVIVINKPAGMLVHSKGAFNPEYTVASFVAQKLGVDDDVSGRIGIVHRLDRQTSGVMITSKNESTSKILMDQFANRQTKKYYIAVVDGSLDTEPFRIDIPLARSVKNPKTFEPNGNGKSAQTGVVCIRATPQYSIVLLKPVTGRTHQLRVHLKHIGHPILGDVEYGAKSRIEPDSKRFLLHAYSLTVTTTEAAPQTYVAQLPDDMTSYVYDEDITAITSSIKQD